MTESRKNSPPKPQGVDPVVRRWLAVLVTRLGGHVVISREDYERAASVEIEAHFNYVTGDTKLGILFPGEWDARGEAARANLLRLAGKPELKVVPEGTESDGGGGQGG